MTDSMDGPRTQEVRRTEAERRLIAAAAEMVGEVGPSKVTLANVGERAGYSRGLATHHFGSKGALMQRLVEAVTHQFRDAMFDQGGADDAPDSPLPAFFGAGWSRLNKKPPSSGA